MQKPLVIDTSILLYDLDSLFKFPDSTLIIPLVVMDELDKFKEECSERGFAARKTLELLDELSKIRPLIDGVVLNELPEDSPYFKQADGLNTKIIKSYRRKYPISHDDMSDITNDMKILACACHHEGVLITMDRSLRILARDFIDVQEYTEDQVKIREIYKGYRRVKVSGSIIDSLYASEYIEDSFGLHANEFVIMENEENPQHVAVGIRKKDGIKCCDFKNPNTRTKPMNLEQKMFLYLLNDAEITCVTASGVSGKGKSLLAVDYGLNRVEANKYVKLLYTKPATPLDKNEYLGYTKGDMLEKMKPHLQPLYNSIEFLYKKHLYDENKMRLSVDTMVDKLIEADTLNFCPLVNIRGMSIFDKVLIMDEAQNTTNHTMKTLVTRMTDTSKLIVIGDIEQIDDKNLNKFNNGMTHLIEEGKDEYFIGHICMDIDSGSRRGKLSEFGSRNL